MDTKWFMPSRLLVRSELTEVVGVGGERMASVFGGLQAALHDLADEMLLLKRCESEGTLCITSSCPVRTYNELLLLRKVGHWQRVAE